MNYINIFFNLYIKNIKIDIINVINLCNNGL